MITEPMHWRERLRLGLPLLPIAGGARSHGKDADFSFNGVALEDELNQISLSFDVPTADITAFADAYQNVLDGGGLPA